MKNYIVFDLEWNQCPSGKDNEVTGVPFEVIEIGAVKLDERWQVVDTFRRYIKPQLYDRINTYTSEVINITMELLNEQGMSFVKACSEFLGWCGLDYTFVIWGDSDLVELQRNMSYYKMESPLDFPLYYLDAQKIYSICCDDGKSRVALKHAVEQLDLDVEEEFHDALSDSVYTTKVIQKINMDYGKRFYSIDTYRIPKSRDEEIKVHFDNYSKYISRGFETREDVMNDSEVITTRCNICGRNSKRIIRWFSSNTKMYYALSSCATHGYVKGRIKIKQNDDGSYYATKILKLTDEAGIKNIKAKQKFVKEKRHERCDRKKQSDR